MRGILSAATDHKYEGARRTGSGLSLSRTDPFLCDLLKSPSGAAYRARVVACCATNNPSRNVGCCTVDEKQISPDLLDWAGVSGLSPRLQDGSCHAANKLRRSLLDLCVPISIILRKTAWIPQECVSLDAVNRWTVVAERFLPRGRRRSTKTKAAGWLAELRSLSDGSRAMLVHRTAVAYGPGKHKLRV